jgi:hypothetical protein
MAADPGNSERTLGGYTLYQELAAGGIGSVSLARSRADAGFSRVMAIKRLHQQFARAAYCVAMFLDEARGAGEADGVRVTAHAARTRLRTVA